MRKLILTICLIFALFTPMLAMANSAEGNYRTRLLGIPLELILNSDGSGTIGQEPLTWQQQQNHLTVIMAGHTNHGILKGNELNLAGMLFFKMANNNQISLK